MAIKTSTLTALPESKPRQPRNPVHDKFVDGAKVGVVYEVHGGPDERRADLAILRAAVRHLRPELAVNVKSDRKVGVTYFVLEPKPKGDGK